jgi:hypothetical protein
MKRALVAASAIAILAGAQSFAQTVGVGPAETIVVEPEQRTVIELRCERVAPVTIKENFSQRDSAGGRGTANGSQHLGARFTKYRYVFKNVSGRPSEPGDSVIIIRRPEIKKPPSPGGFGLFDFRNRWRPDVGATATEVTV